jgi:hypothetical protein
MTAYHSNLEMLCKKLPPLRCPENLDESIEFMGTPGSSDNLSMDGRRLDSYRRGKLDPVVALHSLSRQAGSK